MYFAESQIHIVVVLADRNSSNIDTCTTTEPITITMSQIIWINARRGRTRKFHEHKHGPNVFYEPIQSKHWRQFLNQFLDYTRIIVCIHCSASALDYYKEQKKEDRHLIQTIASSIRTHNYHTKAYINRKYSSVL